MKYLKNANFIKYFKMSQIFALTAVVIILIVDRTVFQDLSSMQKIGLFLTFEYFGTVLAKNIHRIGKETESVELKDKVRMELYFAQVVACVFLSMGLYFLVVKRQTNESMLLFWTVIGSTVLASIIFRIENKNKRVDGKISLTKEETLKRKMTVRTITGRYNTGIFILLGLPTLWIFVKSIGGPTWIPFMVLVGAYSILAVIILSATYFFERITMNNGIVEVANELVILEASVTYTGPLEVSEGYLALSDKELIFANFAISGKAELVKVPLKEIESIERSMTLGMLPTAFTVLNKNGAIHKFHCAKRNLWIEKILQLRHKAVV